MSTRAKAHVCVYLVLKEGDKILLSRRQNTGYEDGNWGLVSGHGETNESATQALCRETFEEIGIIIKPSDLEVIHLMHRKTERENIDIFMHCKTWQGEITNRESEKCGGLEFFSKDSYPKELVGYIQRALENIEQQKVYDELGW
jgi:ADP-ribose pyrophosphatase YjhB (NUDIX family)